MLKLFCSPVESEYAAIVYAYPYVAITVGHHTSRRGMFLACLMLSVPPLDFLAVPPQHHFVLTSRPESSSIGIGSQRIYRVQAAVVVGTPHDGKVRLPGTEEIDPRAVVAHPKVTELVLC